MVRTYLNSDSAKMIEQLGAFVAELELKALLGLNLNADNVGVAEQSKKPDSNESFWRNPALSHGVGSSATGRYDYLHKGDRMWGPKSRRHQGTCTLVGRALEGTSLKIKVWGSLLQQHHMKSRFFEQNLY